MDVKSWPILIAAGLIFLTLASVLVRLVVALIRSNRRQILASGPLAAEQEIAIEEPGEVLLLIEVPRFGSDFRNFEFEVMEIATGQTTKIKYDFARAQGAVYGLTTMRVPLGRMTARQPGVCRVRISGLQNGKDYSTSRLLFSRPYLGRLILQIIGLVACAIGMLLSLLLALWQALPLQRG